MNYERFNAYRIMWLMVSFDLPTDTKDDRRAHALFRKHLKKCGFTMFQYSIYTRPCLSLEYADKYKAAVKRGLPEKGHVAISNMTDKQFGMIEIFHGLKPITNNAKIKQLEFF